MDPPKVTMQRRQMKVENLYRRIFESTPWFILLQSQEREAMQKMREKAKELQRQKLELSKRGIKGGTGSSSYSMSSSSYNSNPSVIQETSTAPIEPSRPSYAKPSGPSKALKLGSKSRDVESFVDQLKSEGERVVPLTQPANSVNNKFTSASSPHQQINAER